MILLTDEIFIKQHLGFILRLLFCIFDEDAKLKQTNCGFLPADSKEIIDILHDKDNDISKRCRLIKLANKHKIDYPKELETLSGLDLYTTLNLMRNAVVLAIFKSNNNTNN